jgi:pectate lyase
MKYRYVVRRAVLCCALVSPLVCPQPATADYSTPDYSITANVTPYTTPGPITIAYSAANLSDVSAPATTVEFSAAPQSNPSQSTVLGQVSLPAIARWGHATGTISFPIPGRLPVGTIGMRLTSNINPARGNGEVKTANNITSSGFSAVVTSATTSPPPTGSPSTSPPTLLPPVVSTALEGFGASTPGGAGQLVYTVTSLAASGPGTLSDAISQGHRNIKFSVAGTINLTDGIRVKGSFITIDGFSAPAPGITLKGGGLYIMNKSITYGFDYGTHDVIVRGIRVRDSVDDAFRVAYSAYNIVIDHVSAEGAGDGGVDITEDSHDVTVSWSIFAGPLSQKNSLLAYRPWRLTMHHNLFIASEDRSPDAAYDYSGAAASDLTLDFRNNLVWDWGGGAGAHIQYGSRANVVNNYFYSPNGDNGDALVVCRAQGVPPENAGDCNNGDAKRFARAFVNGNVIPASLGRDLNAVGTETSAFSAAFVTIQNACVAAESVRTQAGALPLDSVDQSYLSRISLNRSLCP